MIDAKHVHETLGRHQLADGLPFVLDLDRSEGCWLVDARTGDRYLDLFTCFASWPIGWNHPASKEPEFLERLVAAARHKPSNSDLYTEQLAEFVEAFATRATPAGFPHHFWVSGGALAVENAMKVAFDWKAQKVGVDAVDDGNKLSILHFRQAFHGRSGYTMSVTNTVPDKVALFPKFDWPRVHNPAVRYGVDGTIDPSVEAEERRSREEIEAAFARDDEHVAAILIEPIQGEGGDNYFRPEFLAALREYADRHEALLVFDEVQTGFFGTGRAWMWEHTGVRPDVVAFGKKTQVCGIYAGPRVDEVERNVFRVPSRINSTWGGNLVDMVRCRMFLDVILGEKLHENVAARGCEMVAALRDLQRTRGHISNVRGLGSWVAFTLPSPAARDEMLRSLMGRKLLALPSGPDSVRFRMPLVIGAEEVQEAVSRVAACLPERVQA